MRPAPVSTRYPQMLGGTHTQAGRTTNLKGETRFRPSVIGEETLLFVLDKWLQELPEEANAFVDRHPELKDFARDLSNHITIVREWSPGRSGGG
jgi:hypothetical protein